MMNRTDPPASKHPYSSPPAKLRFASFLAPSVFPVYTYISEYVGRRLGLETTIEVGTAFDQFEKGAIDVGFICGLPYVQLAHKDPTPVEVLAAPVLLGERYGGKPIYYSDVIVRRDSPYTTFEELRGCTWSYNDPDSQSGYGITRYHLLRLGETSGFFGEVVEAGFHQESIQLVRRGLVEASAIDSQVLAIAMRDDPTLDSDIKVIASLGPSTIQPVVAASHLPGSLKLAIADVLTGMTEDREAREWLAKGLFSRFVPATRETYDDIEQMLRATEAAGFLKLR